MTAIVKIPKKNETRSVTRRIRSVSVPKDIDDEMRGHLQVNWSKVATDAFELVLTELRKKRGRKK